MGNIHPCHFVLGHPEVFFFFFALAIAVVLRWLQALPNWGSGSFKGIGGVIVSPLVFIKCFRGLWGPEWWILWEPQPESNLTLQALL